MFKIGDLRLMLIILYIAKTVTSMLIGLIVGTIIKIISIIIISITKEAYITDFPILDSRIVVIANPNERKSKIDIKSIGKYISYKVIAR
jgi:hypothetical protein